MRAVGAYEAKTHLPALIEEVARGESVVITKHGRPVAKLVPVDRPEGTSDDIVAALKASRSGLRLGLPVRDLISEGRA